MKKIIFIIFLSVILIVLLINCYVKYSVSDYIVDNVKNTDIDCILVLGAGVRDNKPRPTLKDRLDKAIELYNKGVSNKIVVSGDHHGDYNEVLVMKNYLIENGASEKDIYMDGRGYSTFESIDNIKDVFKFKKIVVVTQKYHLYRALYISKKLGVESIGVSSVNIKYKGNTYREFREILARVKDFIKCIFI